MPRTKRHRSRVAVVTGGASGIGEATCHHLAEQGHRVAVLDLDGDGAILVAKELEAHGVEALGLAVDVTDRPVLDAAFAKIRSALGPTEILVTSAGLVAFDPFEEITVEQWNRVVDVNLTGTFHCCQVAVPDMVAVAFLASEEAGFITGQVLGVNGGAVL